MPLYEFECKSCEKKYDELAKYDESGKYPEVVCPHCGSKKKDRLMSMVSFTFTNPVGTDRWNSESTGHDYRFKHNIPNVQRERQLAEQFAKGENPYRDLGDMDLGEGVHDPETRLGLS
jgi:putative FmdB family regulatory protein